MSVNDDGCCWWVVFDNAECSVDHSSNGGSLWPSELSWDANTSGAFGAAPLEETDGMLTVLCWDLVDQQLLTGNPTTKWVSRLPSIDTSIFGKSKATLSHLRSPRSAKGGLPVAGVQKDTVSDHDHCYKRALTIISHSYRFIILSHDRSITVVNLWLCW